MREHLAEPMRLGDVMAEYLLELEATCANYQATLNEGGHSFATNQEDQ